MEIVVDDGIKQRFLDRLPFVSPAECWEWQGSKDVGGYGRLHVTQEGKRGSIKAHRLSWMIHHGPIPEGMIMCHKCDNPACVNPAHLFVGTWLENMTDRDSKLRHFHGSEVNTSKLTEEKVREIHARYAAGEDNLSALGRAYGVSHTVVRLIITGQTWRHLHLPVLALTHISRGKKRKASGSP